MVLEIAQFEIVAGSQSQFEQGYRSVRHLIVDAGALSVRMTRGTESPAHFVLLVEWDSVQAHEAFRASDAFSQWRAVIGPFFAGTPTVEHYTVLD